MYRVLIADDFPLFRRGVKDLLAEGLGPVTAGEAGTAQEMLTLVQAQRWDIVVMDISMPGRSGPEALRDIKQVCPTLPVLALSMHPEDQYAVRMFKAGADGYLTKTASPTDLVVAVRKLLAGGKYVSPTVGERLASDVSARSDKLPHETLSDREHQILILIASGKGVGEIAQDLALSVTTVSTYRARILDKMQARNNADLIRYAIEHALV